MEGKSDAEIGRAILNEVQSIRARVDRIGATLDQVGVTLDGMRSEINVLLVGGDQDDEKRAEVLKSGQADEE